MSPSETVRLRMLLGPITGAPREIHSLPSGTSGQSYLVVTGTGRYVAKLFSPDSQALLGPAEQYRLLQKLGGAGIAPRAIAVDVAERLLITEFIEGASAIDAATLREPRMILRIAAGLKKLHAIRVPIPGFDPKSDLERYVARTGGIDALSTADRRRHAELVDLATKIEGRPECLCHNDLVAENLLIDGSLWLVDFDYAVNAPPVVDLASVTTLNEFSDRQASALLDAYFDGKTPISLSEFARVQRLVRLLAHFWSLASASSEAAIVAKYRIEDDG